MWIRHGAAAKPLCHGPQGGLRAAGARKGGIGGVHHLEESFFPPADISCDVVATTLLRLRAHQAPAAIRAYQLGRALDCSTSRKSCPWRCSLSPPRFPGPTPARCPHLHPCHNNQHSEPSASQIRRHVQQKCFHQVSAKHVCSRPANRPIKHIIRAGGRSYMGPGKLFGSVFDEFVRPRGE